MAYLDALNLRSALLDDAGLAARALDRRHCGGVQVTSGRIVACDPLVQPDRPAFARAVAVRGTLAVDAVRHLGRHALAVLWLCDRGAVDPDEVRWEAALLAGQSTDSLAAESFYGYPVDSGLGCFMDEDAAAAISARQARHEGEPRYDYYNTVLAPEIGSDDVLDHYPLGAGSANNLVMFGSGWGDGEYPSFWGLDASGEPVALVTDFLTITGGDARSDYRRRADAYRESLSPSGIEALESLFAAVQEDDLGRLRDALSAGLAGANDVVPSTGETAIGSAVRLDKPGALRLLLGDGPVPPLPSGIIPDTQSYLAYAARLTKPRSPELLALLRERTPTDSP